MELPPRPDPITATYVEMALYASAIEQLARENAAEVQKAHNRIARLLLNVGDTGNCRGCGAPIYWVRHRSGVAAPYDPDGTSHFATCKTKEQFRRKQ